MPADDAPPDAKRQRVEFVLQDETEFLQQHSGASKVTFAVRRDTRVPGKQRSEIWGVGLCGGDGGGVSQVRILCPEEADFSNLNGQVMEVEVASLSTTIGDLKGRLADVLSLPRNKQQLSREHFKTMRDNQSLAYYNVLPSVELALSVRRRGGR